MLFQPAQRRREDDLVELEALPVPGRDQQRAALVACTPDIRDDRLVLDERALPRRPRYVLQNLLVRSATEQVLCSKDPY